DLFARRNLAKIGGQAGLLEAMAREAQGELRAPDRHLEASEQSGQGAEGIFVGVREHDALERLRLGQQPAEIGKDDLDARPVSAGKHQTAVDEQALALVLEHHRVEADLPEAAERRELERRGYLPLPFFFGAFVPASAACSASSDGFFGGGGACAAG